MTSSPTSNSPVEIEWRRDVMERVFKQFDEDSDGKLSAVEVIRFLFLQEDSKIEICQILQAFDDGEDSFFRSLRNMNSFDLSLPLLGLIFKDMQAKAFNWKSSEEDHVVIDIEQLNVLLPVVPDEYTNISKLRDMFLGLTGQAAVSFVAYAPSTRPLNVLMAANSLAFLLLLLSFWVRGKKLVSAERIMGSLGIGFAVLVFFLMMGMISIPVKIT
ncbi:conserved hypothetical protein [Ricinus communis]|uniref:EF-hand domain-containing protein n=1 Tax=Ricinus communis TaxID=3988 RepID=B9SX56_RICCO|nr:conserved hypothetical protein [Ricinus communis]